MGMTTKRAMKRLSIFVRADEDCYKQAAARGYMAAAAAHKWDMEAHQLAIAALQEKAEREDPKPLTLEELRQMDGEPVYIVYASAEPCEWVVFDHHNDDGFGTPDNCWWFAKGYGKAWEAYRHKPKEVTK